MRTGSAQFPIERAADSKIPPPDPNPDPQPDRPPGPNPDEPGPDVINEGDPETNPPPFRLVTPTVY